MTFIPGQRYRLLADYGNQAYDPIGGMRHGLPVGAIGTLVLEVPAAEPGAHNDLEDAFVLEFTDEARALGEDGNLVVTPSTRRVSFAVTDFDPANPDRRFDPA